MLLSDKENNQVSFSEYSLLLQVFGDSWFKFKCWIVVFQQLLLTVDIETLPLGNFDNCSLLVVFKYHFSLGGSLSGKSFQILSYFHLIKKTPTYSSKNRWLKSITKLLHTRRVWRDSHCRCLSFMGFICRIWSRVSCLKIDKFAWL